MKKFLMGFVYAGRGFVTALYERNFRFHICAAAFIIFVAASFYELSKAEWAVLLLTIGIVIALEALNTAVEHLANEVTQKKSEHIRRCKDCAAAAVLISAIAAVAVGIALLGDIDRLAEMWKFFSSDIWRMLSLIAAIVAAVMFVLLPERYKSDTRDKQ